MAEVSGRGVQEVPTRAIDEAAMLEAFVVKTKYHQVMAPKLDRVYNSSGDGYERRERW